MHWVAPRKDQLPFAQGAFPEPSGKGHCQPAAQTSHDSAFPEDQVPFVHDLAMLLAPLGQKWPSGHGSHDWRPPAEKEPGAHFDSAVSVEFGHVSGEANPGDEGVHCAEPAKA